MNSLTSRQPVLREAGGAAPGCGSLTGLVAALGSCSSALCAGRGGHPLQSRKPCLRRQPEASLLSDPVASPQKPIQRSWASDLSATIPVHQGSNNPVSVTWSNNAASFFWTAPALERENSANPATSSENNPSCLRLASRCSASSDLSKVRKEITCLCAVRRHFRAFDNDGSGDISPDELAQCWARAASSNYGRPLRPGELALIAARVERSFAELDVRRTARIGVDEWMHCALMERYSPGPAAAAAIAERIRAEGDERTIPRLLQSWSKADPEGSGMVLREVLTQSELSGHVVADMMDAMNWDGAPDLSYAEYCAQRMGLQNRRVELYLYDLSKSMASYLSPILVGHTEEGIWHSGVVVFGREYYYYGNICCDEAGKTPFGTPTKVLQLGCTLRTEEELQEFLEGREGDYQPELYDALEHNCNHLSDETVSFLLGRHIPNSVRLMSDRLRTALVVKALLPVLNRVLGLREDTRARTPKSRPSVSGKTVTDSAAPPSQGSEASSLTSLLSCELGSESVNLVLAEVPDCCEPVAAHVLRVHDGDGAYDLAWFDDTGHFRVTADVPRVDVRQLHGDETQEGVFGRRIYETALNSLKQTPALSFHLEETIFEDPLAEADAAGDCRSVCPRGHALQAARPRCWQGYTRRRACGRCSNFIPRVDVRLRCDACRYDLCEECFERSKPSTDPRPSTKCRPSLSLAGGEKPVLCPKGHQMQVFTGQAMCNSGACSLCGQQDLGATAPYFYSCRLCLHSVCAACARRSFHEDLAKGWNGRIKKMTLLASRTLLMRSGSNWSKVSS